MERKQTYLLEEYKSIRAEIESYSDRKRQLEIYIITAILVVYGWVGSLSGDATLKYVAIFSPIALVAFGIYKIHFCNIVIKKQSEYIKSHIETEFLDDTSLGWESFWEKSKKLPLLRRGEYAFWFCLLLMTIAVPVLI